MRTQIPGKQILDQGVETEDIKDGAITDTKLSTTGVDGGTYTKVTVNEQGRVTDGENPTTLAGYGITDGVAYTDPRFDVSFLSVTDETDVRPGARQVIGVPNEITTLDNGPGIGATFDIGIADNAVLPGTGAITLVSGTTEQRPAAAPGKVRYNTTTNVLETPVGAAWHSIVLSNNEVFTSDTNVLQVRKDPKSFQFGSIAAACASLVGVATETSQWLIDVGPGLYVEPEIVIPSYVHVSGFTEYAVYVQPAGTDHPAFSLERRATLSLLNVWDATGPGQAGVRCYDTTDGVILHKVCVLRASIGFDLKAQTADGIVYLEYCDTQQTGGIGVNIDSDSAEFEMYVNLENFYVYGDDGNPLIGLNMNGPNVYVNMQSFGMEGVDGTGEAFNLANGAHLDAKAGSIFGWDVAAHLENTGLPVVANFTGTPFHGNTSWDLWSEHPLNTGTLSGTATRTKVNAAASPGFTSAFADVANNEYVQTGDFYMGKTQELLTNVSDLIIETPPMGLLEGGSLQPIGGFNVLSAGGIGYLRKDGNVTRIDWPDSVIAIDPGTTVYVYVTKNGVLAQSVAEPDILTNITLGRVSAGPSGITGIGPTSVDIKNHSNKLEDYLRKAVGPVYVTGSIVTENVTSPRGIDITAGQWFYGTQSRNPHQVIGSVIVDGYRSAGQTVLVPRMTVPNDTIDNGTDLVPVTTGYFTKHAIYSSSDGIFQVTFLAHAQAEYATLDEARLAPLPVPRISSDATPVIAAAIMQQGVNSIVEIQDIRPMFMREKAGSGGTTSDHGDLIGLQDDDHPQYMLASGARALAGDLNLGENDLTNVGLINGLNFSTHGSRHSPQGVDPIPTAAAVSLSPTSVNAIGNANFLARSDHTHDITGFQPLNAELTALGLLETPGILVHAHGAEGAHTWETREIAGAGGRITITNGDAVEGNPTIDLSTVGTAGTYALVTTDIFGRVTSGTATLDWSKIANVPTTLSGYGITDAQFKSDILTSLSETVGTGTFVITGPGTATTRSIIGPAAGVIVTNGSGVAGNPTISLGNDLAAVESLTTTGFAVRAGADTWVTRSFSAPGNGVNISNGSGVAGDLVISIANDLAAIEAISTTGIAVRTGNETWATRSILGTAGNVVVTGGTGVGGDPTINLATAGTAGTYKSVTTDTFGRVVGGTNPTTLAGYGITDAVSTTLIGANSGIATLDSSGKLSAGQIPALAISDTFVVASQAAMLALTAEIGDVAVRTDLNKSFILRLSGANVLGNWQELLTPTDAVLSVNGQTGAVTVNVGVTSISASAPVAGLTIGGAPITSTGTLTFALANDLAAVEGLATNGLAVRTALDTWTTRAITSGTGIAVTNGDGIAGAPTIALSTAGTAGTYKSVTTDAFGRVTAGTNPTTLAGFGITDAISISNASSANTPNFVVQRDASGNFSAGTITANLTGVASSATKLATARTIGGVSFDGTANITLTSAAVGLGNVTNAAQVVNAGGTPQVSSGTFAARPAFGTVGALYLATDTRVMYRDTGSAWDAMEPAFTGDVTSSAGSTVLTLNNTITAGTYDRVTVNAKGLVTAGDVTTDRMNLMFSGSIPVQTGTSTITLGATAAPTSTQGTQLVSQVITPASVSSRIVIEFSGIVDTNFNGGVFVTVFRGTTFLGMAITATQAAAGNTNVSMPITFSTKIIDTPGVLTAQTYTIRIGGNAAGTWYLGRTEGLSIGGVNKSYWSMTEII